MCQDRSIFELTEKQLYDYLYCPVYYDLLHNFHALLEEKDSQKALLNKCVLSFFSSMLGGYIMTTGDMKKKWDRLCADANFTNDKKIIEGIGLILNFHRWAMDKKPMVLDVGTPYHLRFQDTVWLTGKTGTILFGKDEEHGDLFVVDYGAKVPDDAGMVFKTRWALACEAAEKSARCKINGVRLLHIKTGKEFRIFRHPRSKERLERSVLGAAECIQKGIYFPRETTCVSCFGKTVCAAWPQ